MRLHEAPVLAVAGLVMCLDGGAALGAGSDGHDLRIKTATCTVTALTTCEKGFCTFIPDAGVKPLFLFDFERRTYVNMSLGPEPKPMQAFEVVHSGAWQQIRFTVRMAHETANVTFNATAPQLGPVSMTAAAVFSYPAPSTRLVVDGLTCAS